MLKSSLLLFGSFAFAHNFSDAIHEVGHALSVWISGGVVTRFVVHPFSKPFVVFTSPKNMIVTNWAGIVLDAILPLSIVVLLRRVRSPYLMPIAITAIVGLGTEGIYLIFDTATKGGGDPTELIRLGASKISLLAAGLLMVSAGLTLAGIFSPLLGIRPEDSIQTRIVILEAGLLPYLCLAVIYCAVFLPHNVRNWGRGAAIAAIVLFFIGGISRLLERRISLFRMIDVAVVEWNNVLLALTLGILAIALPLYL